MQRRLLPRLTPWIAAVGLVAAAVTARPQDPASGTREPAVPAGIRALLDDLHAAAATKDVDAVLERFDLVGLLREHGLYREEQWRPSDEQFRSWLRPRLLEGLRVRGLGLAWSRLQVRAVAIADDGATAVLTTRTWDAEGDARTTRWSLVHADRTWRLREMQDVATGLSLHLGAGLAVAARTDESAVELLRRLRLVQEAHDRLQSGDAQGAYGLVRDLDVDGLGNRLRASRLLVLGGVELARGRPARALPHYERAASIDPDAPVTDYLRAFALNRVGRHQEALTLAQSFVRRLGGDADATAEVAVALAALGQPRRARAAARAALDDDPSSTACLVELGVLLEPKERRELTNRLLRLEDPVLAAATLLPDLIDRHAYTAAGAAIDAIAESAPGDPEADYWGGEMALARGRPAEAARLFARALPRVASDEDRTVFQEAYLEAMLALNEPLRAYAAFAGSPFAFEFLADALVETRDGVALRDLVSVHRKYAAEDPWLAYFGAHALELSGARDRAESEYAAAMARLTDPDLLEVYRAARVDNLLLAGDAMDAYARVPPRRATFDQLAQTAVWDADWKLLTRLTRAHRDEDPSDPTIDFWEAEADALGGRYDDAVSKLIARREDLAGTRIGADRVIDRIVRYLARLGKFAEAHAEATEATARDGDPFLESVVHAWRDDPPRLMDAIEAGLDFGHDVEDYYADPDVGQRLTESAKLRSVRERYPKPAPDAR